MRWRTIGLASALSGALALGLSFGMIGQSAVASAQTTPQATTTTGTSTLGNLFLDKLAEALGIQRAALDTAMSSAAGSAATQAVADGTITQAQADALTARAQAGDYGALLGGRGGPHGPRVPGVHEAMLEAAAQTLGLTANELHTALHAGQTVAELAAANGTSEQAVTDAALAAAKTELDAAVTAGTLTQAQADQFYTELEARGVMLGGPGGRGGHGGPGGRGERTPPADGTAPAAPVTTPDA